MLNLGNASAKDFALGQNLVERIDFGSNVVFDPYTNITGNLPLQFNSRVTANLKNYRLYGASEGAGVETESGEPAGYKIPLTNTSGETENAWDGSYEHAVLSGATPTEFKFVTSINGRTAIVPCEPNTTYTIKKYSESNRLIIADSANRPNNEDVCDLLSNSIGETMIAQVTTHINAHWMSVYVSTSSEQAEPNITVTKGSTAPDHYIPHRYTADYNLYIGSTKLGEEEYVDYQEQKVYKRTANLFNKDDFILADLSLYNETKITSSTTACIIVMPCEANTQYVISIPNYDSTVWRIGLSDYEIPASNQEYTRIVSEKPSGNVSTFTTLATTKNILLQIQKATVGIAKNSIMLVSGSTAPESYIPYLQPTDPPAPLPAITAYQGENTLSSTETVGEVTVRGRISPLLGTALTQANYDLITPVSTMYYPIYTTANGENIWTVKEMTAQEYAALTSYDISTLYLIMSGSNVEDAYVGSVECDKVYLGSTVVYEQVSYLLPDWFPQIDIESYFAPYQSNSDYYFDAISADGNLPNWNYYYERTYYQNPAQGEVDYDKTGTYTIRSYATWYTTSTSHKTVTLKVVNGNVENIQMTEGSWTTSRAWLNSSNIEHQNNEKPWLIKQTMTTVNITGNYTPELIGF